MDAVSPPSYPFHLAKAYAAAAPVRPAAAFPTITTAAGLTIRPSGDVVELSGARPAALDLSVQRLAAARVEKAPDFAAPPATLSGPSLPMYRHPADRNIAATGVQLGRTIDFSA
jgi:hypothetical protein